MTATMTRPIVAAVTLFRQLRDDCKSPPLRSMRRFAEQEIYLPDGPYEGERFDCDRQPFTALWFDEVDSGRWWRFVTTGPTQDGKTLVSYLIPTMYHLFERRETVICGIPQMEMAGHKWRNDILPVIQSSRYRDFLPLRGQGSRGGKVEEVLFRNGARLKFMSGAGDDQKRAGYTAPVLVITEADGMDEASGVSREADPITQMERRIESYIPFGLARVYMECTVSIDTGRITREYQSGSASRMVIPCSHCRAWVTPEREHFKGWEDAEDELQAAELAHIACPECGEPWTEDQRIASNRQAKILHRGQEVAADGTIVGPPPRTNTFAFTWNRANSSIKTLDNVAAEEWDARRDGNQGDKEKALKQTRWTIPVEADQLEVADLSMAALIGRQSPTPMGLVPAWADVLTLGVDCGQWLLHWTLLAGDMARKRHIQIVDYGVEEVHSRQFAVDEALSMALGAVAGRAEDADRGWPDENGEQCYPDLVWYDAGWKPVPVYKHCRKAGPRHWPAKGQGLGQYGGVKYHVPKTTGTTVRAIYDGFHLAKIKHAEAGVAQLYEHDADRAKARVHDRLAMPIDEAGAMLLPQVDRAVEHTTFAKHLLAEELIEEDGLQKWRKTPGHGGHNHWLDATALALLALMRRWTTPQAPPRVRRAAITKPDGRPFVTPR